MQRVGCAREPLKPDEVDGELLAAAGRLRGDQHMHLRELTGANPVHECDFGPVVIEIAERIRAIEKHPQRGSLCAAGAVLSYER